MGAMLEACPSHAILARLGDRWSAMVLIGLWDNERRLRFSELRRLLAGVSPHMLSTTLRWLERDGLLRRHIYAQVPPRTEYELTPLGRSVVPPLRALLGSIADGWPVIAASRQAYDGSRAD